MQLHQLESCLDTLGKSNNGVLQDNLRQAVKNIWEQVNRMSMVAAPEVNGLLGETIAAYFKAAPGQWGKCATPSIDFDHVRYITGDDGQVLGKIAQGSDQSLSEVLATTEIIVKVHNCMPAIIAAMNAAAKMAQELGDSPAADEFRNAVGKDFGKKPIANRSGLVL